ncbi:MAG: hypothetical protein F6K56_08445 [Moorea sp. SIO3G5]|nr:hypothetical protein [Moorena sp. SIO3G5]
MVYDIYLTVSIQLSAISYQLSAISYQLSAISYQPMGHSVEACATVLFAQREPKADGTSSSVRVAHMLTAEC